MCGRRERNRRCVLREPRHMPNVVVRSNGTFGARVRELREAKGIGLRKFAKLVGVTPTYLSKIERGEFAPPAEDKVVAIAKALDVNPDEMLALAGRVASDLSETIRLHPFELASLIR